MFIHIKRTDSYGEDGNLEGKAKIIEEVDLALPVLLDLNPDVLMITGDHSTPSVLKSHSWHPVPFLLWAPETHRTDLEDSFTERNCARGGLGTFPAVETMSLGLAHAGRLQKFGAWKIPMTNDKVYIKEAVFNINKNKVADIAALFYFPYMLFMKDLELISITSIF